MLTIEKYPRCKAYLNAMWIKPPYTGMNDYWCAVCVAESFSDKYLVQLGTINFEAMSGAQLLAAFERLLKKRSKGQPSRKTKKCCGNSKPMPISTITAAVSSEEIKSAMTPKGGFKAGTLAAWGISWPPPRGWRQKLEENYRNRQGAAMC